jgi:hypothetical protein
VNLIDPSGGSILGPGTGCVTSSLTVAKTTITTMEVVKLGIAVANLGVEIFNRSVTVNNITRQFENNITKEVGNRSWSRNR